MDTCVVRTGQYHQLLSGIQTSYRILKQGPQVLDTLEILVHKQKVLAKRSLIARSGNSYPSQFLQTKFLQMKLVLGISFVQAFQVVLVVKNPPTNEREVTDTNSVPALGRSPGKGEGNGYPLQYSCLENSMDRVAWQATVHGATKSQTQLSD